VASAVPGLDPAGEQLLSIRQVVHCGKADLVVRQLPRLACSRGHKRQGAHLVWYRYDPFAIRRNRLTHAFADPHWRRAVRVAEKYGVIRAPTISFFLKQ